MAGRKPVPFGFRQARLTAPVGGDITWTQFFQAKLEENEGRWLAHPLKMKSRLQSQSGADALIRVPEGVERLNEGDEINVQVLGAKK
jgi:molybdopterin biosynthesis enzyme